MEYRLFTIVRYNEVTNTPSKLKPNMHARIKLFVKVDYDEFQRNSRRKARRQEKLKDFKSSYPTGGKKARKGEVRQEQRTKARINARHEKV